MLKWSTAPFYNLLTAELKHGPHAITGFLCARVETAEMACPMDGISILIGQHLYPHPARTGSHCGTLFPLST